MTNQTDRQTRSRTKEQMEEISVLRQQNLISVGWADNDDVKKHTHPSCTPDEIWTVIIIIIINPIVQSVSDCLYTIHKRDINPILDFTE